MAWKQIVTPALVLAASLFAAGAAASNRSVVQDPSLRQFLEKFEEGTRRFINGDTALWMENVSRRGDVMIMGAWGDHEKGWHVGAERRSCLYDGDRALGGESRRPGQGRADGAPGHAHLPQGGRSVEADPAPRRPARRQDLPGVGAGKALEVDAEDSARGWL